MPLYEYLCESCGERTEILQRFGDLSEIVCPSCGAPMRKLPSAPSIQFKGSGFYLTDYAKKSGGTEGTSPRGGSDKAADKAGEKSSEAGTAKSAGAGSDSGGGSSAPDSASSSTPSSAPAPPAAGKTPAGSGGA
ncbi:MAG: FmdB family transcriptional regulator [Thermoanaerobaculia bacterium]|nr:FmdB family transcriptional regulator [Thermoanaerobaculia bacterium]MBP9824275.1 FmdB family transcriptional regulator [Thermoanaerobaculia bacterium]